ncbi:hypothetical protein HNY73_001250 [Argiope bruennichi]|uniref:Uncharacterized protein n=1 Tax=Argiope bruennichi TaxID=94029 RepID=A0A8T0G1U4_ARGBR|nr:hypothetical protein HNY73_001250 [Argiope bruennichi]
MNPIFLPSLQHMASVKIAVQIYCNREIQSTYHQMNNIPSKNFDQARHITYKGWKRIKEITMKILPAELPQLLKTRLADFIRPIQEQKDAWMCDHPYVYIYTYDNSYFNCISWKSDGTIDRLQTAKNMLRNKSFHFVGRFMMACTYFLEEDIWNLREKMKGERLAREDNNVVIRFWRKWLKQRNNIHWSQMFSEHFINPKIISSDSPIRVTRIFDILPQESRWNYLVKISGKGHSDDVRLCLYQLDEQQRIEFMKSYPHRILIAFLKWPFQSQFMKMANQMWGYMSADAFHFVMSEFLKCYVLRNLEYFDYLGLFREFWCSSPEFFKENIRKREQFQIIGAILNYAENSRTLSFEDAKKYFHLLRR